MNYNVTSDLKHVTVVFVSTLRFYKQQVFLKVHFVAKKLINCANYFFSHWI